MFLQHSPSPFPPLKGNKQAEVKSAVGCAAGEERYGQEGGCTGAGAPSPDPLGLVCPGKRSSGLQQHPSVCSGVESDATFLSCKQGPEEAARQRDRLEKTVTTVGFTGEAE